MAVTPKPLIDAQLAGAKGTLYTVPALTQAIIQLISLVNTDASARTCNVYLKAGATSRRITPKDLSLGAGEAFYLRGPFTLDAGDLVEGDASVANVIDVTGNGAEVTA